MPRSEATAKAWAKRSNSERTYPPVCYTPGGKPRTGKYMEVCHRPCRPAHFKRPASKISPWMLALKKWNQSNTSWCVPKKPSPGYTLCVKYKNEIQRRQYAMRNEEDDELDLPLRGYLDARGTQAPIPGRKATMEAKQAATLQRVNYGKAMTTRRSESAGLFAESSAQGTDIPLTKARAQVAANKVAEEKKRKEDAARLAEDYKLAHQMAIKDAAAVAARRERHRELTGYYPLASSRSGRGARGFR
jgi:hypothetical protein